MSAFDQARDIRDAHKDAIVALPGVAGSVIGRNDDGDACIRIYLERGDHQRAYADLIRHIEGIPVVWEVTGPIVALAHGDVS